MEWAIGAPFEDTIATVRLVASGLLEQFGELTWVIPHLGGTVPFLLHRLLWRWRLEAELLGTPAHHGESIARLLWDTANCSPATLRLALDVLPADRVVFGTDFPFVDPTDLARPVQLVRGLHDDGIRAAPVLADVLTPLLSATAPAAPMTPTGMDPV
jgi:predicted TIM-barrel fold metal-dependent hydrolase